MSFGSVVEEISNITLRYDKEEQIRSSLNRFIRKISNTGRYPQNLVEVTEPNNSNESIVTVALPDRFQAVDYVRPSGCKGNLNIITSGNYKVGDFGYYVVGSNLLIRHPYSENEIYIGWYVHPSTLTADIESNWILDSFENELIDMTAAYLQGTLGNDKAWQSLQVYSEQFLRTMISNYSSPYGR